MDDRTVGREAEAASLERWLDLTRDGTTTLLIEGEAGIGKSTVLRTGIARARLRSYTVLASQPTRAEERFSFAALADLLDPVAGAMLEALPDVQRAALEVALLRRAADARRQNPRTVAVATLGCLRALAEAGPLVVAIDDLQWLDAASRRALAFALRRLQAERVGILLARRGAPGGTPPLDVDTASHPGGLQRLAIGPLSTDDVRSLLETQLGWQPGRGTLLRLHQLSGGNPLFALELGRALREHDEPAPGEPLPVPETLRELVLQRIRRIPAQQRDVLVSAAALRRPTLELLGAAPSGQRHAVEAIDTAERAGLVSLRGQHVVFAHPLLSSVIYAAAPAARRRTIHLGLASVVADAEERARHLALAATAPDAAIAAALENAARFARARGAPDAAAELVELALQLTPSGDTDDARRRRLLAADHHVEAGDPAAAQRLLEPALAADVPGDIRAGALRRLAEIAFRDRGPAAAHELLERALADVGDGDTLEHARIRTLLCIRALTTSELPEVAARHADRAAAIGRLLGEPAAEAEATAYLLVARVIGGQGLRRDLLPRTPDLDSGLPTRHWRGVLLMFAEDFAGARRWLEALRRQLSDLGDESLLPETLYWLTELEWRAGRWDMSRACASEAWELAVHGGQGLFRAFVAPYLAATASAAGRVDEGRAMASEGLAVAEASGHTASITLNRWALGFAALTVGDAEAAAAALHPAWELTERRGFREPGLFLFHADLVEALVRAGQATRAEPILDAFEKRGRRTGGGYAQVGALRCRELLAAASADLEAAVAAGERALVRLDGLAMPLERARTLLVHGAVLRRVKRKRAARDTLERAAAIFRELGATAWERHAAAELDRLGLRPGDPGGALTPTEERVARLVASGLTNQQVAATMSLSIRTVEANLTRVYRKLGVRRRAELVRLLTSTARSPDADRHALLVDGEAHNGSRARFRSGRKARPDGK